MPSKKKNKKTILGIDIGGTKIACALVANGHIVSKIIKIKTPHGKKILGEIDKIYKEFAKNNIISAIGVSTAGMVNDDGKIVGSTPNISGWEGTEVKGILSKRYRLPVVVENDANAACFADYQIGSAKGSNPLILVILGTGVGGGVIVNGKLIRGAHYAGGEIGHLPLSYTKQRYCNCGKYDCFEAYASGHGLNALIKHYFSEKVAKEMTTYKLFRLAKSKKSKELSILSKRILEDWHFYIALGLSTLIHTIDPQKIILSGGLSSEVNIKYLSTELEKLVIPALKDKVRNKLVEISILKNDAGLLGAALLASQHVEL